MLLNYGAEALEHPLPYGKQIAGMHRDRRRILVHNLDRDMGTLSLIAETRFCCLGSGTRLA